MVAAVLTLLWRDVPGVTELTRILAREGFLWCNPTQISQQAVSNRFLTFPAELFERVFKDLLPNLRLSWSKLVTGNTLLLLDRGFYHFSFWLQLIEKKIHFISRLKKGASIKVEKVFTDSYSLRDRLICLGSGTKRTPSVRVRLVEIRSGKTWHSYVTSVLEPTILPPDVVADLYRKRWRIEQAFNTVTRLLCLSYLWTGSINGIKLQIWATCGATPRRRYAERYPLGQAQGNAHRWLFYAVLMDLGDAIANELALPVDRISLEMIYRGLYHFSVAHQKGLTDNPIPYFIAPDNQDLGIVKSIRKPPIRLIIAPFPSRQKNSPNFFFPTGSQTPLTTALQP